MVLNYILVGCPWDKANSLTSLPYDANILTTCKIRSLITAGMISPVLLVLLVGPAGLWTHDLPLRRPALSQLWGVLASTTATAAKTSLLKWISVFSNFVAFIPIRWKCLMSANFPGVDFLGPHSSLERETKFSRRLLSSFIKHEIRHFHVVVAQ